MNIPFYQTYTLPQSAENVEYLVRHSERISDRKFTQACKEYFEKLYPGKQALMVNSCTRALELIVYSLNLGKNDEVILPSFNYVGVANAFAQTGAKLVFADIDPAFMNITVESIKPCLTTNTRVVVVMNYAGAGHQLKEIQEFCRSNNLVFVEDNAQGIQSTYEGVPLGSFGDLSCISFDSLKNVSCGEGGVLLYKQEYAKQILTIFNSGTNREAFERGEVEAYEWVTIGSKFAISEFNSAILLPLLLNSEEIIEERRARWDMLYDTLWAHAEFRDFLPRHLKAAGHNAHVFYLKLANESQRNGLMNAFLQAGISSSFHYTPLHSSIMGLSRNYPMPVDDFTSEQSACLLRLPMFNALSQEQMEYIAQVMHEHLVGNKIHIP